MSERLVDPNSPRFRGLFNIEISPYTIRALLQRFFPERVEEFDALPPEAHRDAGFLTERDIQIPAGWPGIGSDVRYNWMHDPRAGTDA